MFLRHLKVRVGSALFMCAFFAHAQSPVVNWKIPTPERFPRYKTDGTVPEYKGEAEPEKQVAEKIADCYGQNSNADQIY